MARSKMYIYRVEMRKNGKEDDTASSYIYARNAKCAKKFCKEHFGKFDKVVCTKFGTTDTVTPDVDASFIEKGEMELAKANVAGHGEIYAERDEVKG